MHIRGVFVVIRPCFTDKNRCERNHCGSLFFCIMLFSQAETLVHKKDHTLSSLSFVKVVIFAAPDMTFVEIIHQKANFEKRFL